VLRSNQRTLNKNCCVLELREKVNQTDHGKPGGGDCRSHFTDKLAVDNGVRDGRSDQGQVGSG
jgi:hypothetical protein